MKHPLKTFACIAASVAVFGTAHAALAFNCTLGFGQVEALNAMPYEQAYGFASSPWYKNSCSIFDPPYPPPAYFLIDEPAGGHYHITPDDPTISCFTTNATWPNGVFGRPSGSSCVAVDPLRTSRTATAHTGASQIRVRLTSGTAIPWRPSQITVKGSVAAQVLVEQTDGTWWSYTNLGAGTSNLFSNGKAAKQVLITNQNTANGPTSWDNLKLSTP